MKNIKPLAKVGRQITMGNIGQELTLSAKLMPDTVTMDTYTLKRQSLRNWMLMSNLGAGAAVRGKMR